MMGERNQNATFENPLTNRISSTDSSPMPMIFRITSEGRLEIWEMLKSKEDGIGIPEEKGLKGQINDMNQSIILSIARN